MTASHSRSLSQWGVSSRRSALSNLRSSSTARPRGAVAETCDPAPQADRRGDCAAEGDDVAIANTDIGPGRRVRPDAPLIRTDRKWDGVARGVLEAEG